LEFYDRGKRKANFFLTPLFLGIPKFRIHHLLSALQQSRNILAFIKKSLYQRLDCSLARAKTYAVVQFILSYILIEMFCALLTCVNRECDWKYQRHTPDFDVEALTPRLRSKNIIDGVLQNPISTLASKVK
jgi:membrane-associated PAP2 superfamily phosphatase